MPVKHHRQAVRPHSRSSSATKLASNLQFTQKEVGVNKSSKRNSAITHHPHDHGHRPQQRTNSAVLLDPGHKRPTTPKHHAKPKAGFTIAASPEDDDNEEDWVSSESGAVTPSHNDDGDDDSSVATPVDRNIPDQLQAKFRDLQMTDSYTEDQRLHRTPTIQNQRPSKDVARDTFHNYKDDHRDPPPQNGRHAPPQRAPSPPSPNIFKTPGSLEPMHQAPPSHLRPTNGRRHTPRPPSTHSTHSVSKQDPLLRPHPLIRSNSHAPTGAAYKPAPLAPLTILTDEPTGEQGPGSPYLEVRGSPESISTASPSSRFSHLGRKTSFSSATSSATLPVQPLSREPQHPRTRTLSTLSHSASSNALSSLAHLPAVSRPPSPQTVSFFPVSNPRQHMEAIHPLLPPTYLQGHLTILRHRQPLKECYDRVMWTKQRQ